MVVIENRIVPFIIGGDDAPEGLYTFIAAVKRFGDYKCGGSLITPRHVLTAKHCAELLDLSKYDIVLAEHDTSVSSGREQHFKVDSVIKHDDADIDAAIIVLDRNATLNEHVTLVKLASVLPPVGSEVTAMGWGYIRSGSSAQARVLQSVNIPIAGNSECDAEDYQMKGHEMCGGDGTRAGYTNICRGDSGSPVIYPANATDASKMSQVAFAARGHSGCPVDKRFAAFVSVPAIYEWIVCNTNLLEVVNVSAVDCGKPSSTTISASKTTLTRPLTTRTASLPVTSEEFEVTSGESLLGTTAPARPLRTITGQQQKQQQTSSSSAFRSVQSKIYVKTTTSSGNQQICNSTCLIILCVTIIILVIVMVATIAVCCCCKSKPTIACVNVDDNVEAETRRSTDKQDVCQLNERPKHKTRRAQETSRLYDQRMYGKGNLGITW